jgi:hypothetical protein
VALVLAGPAAEAEAEAEITVAGAWARPTLGQSRTVAGYLTILNGGANADRLVAVETEVARAAEIHATVVDGDVMQMRRVESLEIPPGGRVMLRPGDMHLMLIDVDRQLKQGELVTVTFRFERHAPVTSVMIVSMKPPPGPRGSFGSGPGG